MLNLIVVAILVSWWDAKYDIGGDNSSTTPQKFGSVGSEKRFISELHIWLHIKPGSVPAAIFAG